MKGTKNEALIAQCETGVKRGAKDSPRSLFGAGTPGAHKAACPQ